MGNKRLCKPSIGISKNDRKQLNILVQVLRPKVYITNPSNFKTLVQELTGNSYPVSSPPPLPALSEPSSAVRLLPSRVIEIEDDGAYQGTSFELSSLELRVPFSSAPHWEHHSSAEESGIQRASSTEPESSPVNPDGFDFSAYKSIESWLMENDPCIGGYEGYARVNGPTEGYLFDYDLLGFI